MTYRKLAISQIKRKRKRTRHAVDPCLGFYFLSPALQLEVHSGSPHLAIQHDSWPHTSSPVLRADKLSPYTPLREQNVPTVRETSILDSVSGLPLQGEATNPSGPNTAVVTVEEFLRRSAEKPTKNYGRKKHRIVDLGTSCRAHQLAENKESNDTQPKRPRKRRRTSASRSRSPSGSPYVFSKTSDHPDARPRRKRRIKSLAARIVRAAILSHAEPKHGLLHKNTSVDSSRHPLKFVPATRSSPNAISKYRTCTLVDPRETSTFHQASFSRESSLSAVTKNKPLSTWRTIRDETRCEDPPHKKTKVQVVRKQGIPLRISDCPPLAFVPLRDAEEAYTVKMSSV